MNLRKLAVATAEAERFLERARVAQEAHHNATRPRPGYEEQARAYQPKHLNTSNPRENGALRRSSMDLTRALSDLRKPD